MWRSLVSRLTGGQEAAGSSPVTRTKSVFRKEYGLFLFRINENATTVGREDAMSCARYVRQDFVNKTKNFNRGMAF